MPAGGGFTTSVMLSSLCAVLMTLRGDFERLLLGDRDDAVLWRLEFRLCPLRVEEELRPVLSDDPDGDVTLLRLDRFSLKDREAGGCEDSNFAFACRRLTSKT